MKIFGQNSKFPKELVQEILNFSSQVFLNHCLNSVKGKLGNISMNDLGLISKNFLGSLLDVNLVITVLGY